MGQPSMVVFWQYRRSGLRNAGGRHVYTIKRAWEVENMVELSNAMNRPLH